MEEHRLFVDAQLANLIKQQHPAIGGPEQTGAGLDGAGEGAFHMAKQGGHRPVAADRSAIDLDKQAGHLAASFFKLINAAGQERLARAGRPHQEQRGFAFDAMATRSICSMSWLNSAFRVSMPDLRKESDSVCS